MEINAAGIYYRDLNNMIRQAVSRGESDFVLSNINGQRYIGNGISRKIKLLIKGTPGQDMAAFMKGPEIVVEGNAQDGIGNTMDDGKIVVRGMAGDIVGYGMRGGQIYIGGDVGYRVGADELGVMRLTAAERDHDIGRVARDVIVRDDVSVVRDDEAVPELSRADRRRAWPQHHDAGRRPR